MVQNWGHGVHLNFFLEKIFDVVIRSNMVAIFFSPRPGGQCGGGQEMGQFH